MRAPATVDPLAWVDEELAELTTAGLRRDPATIGTVAAPEVLIDGRPHLLLGSNNYLDLARHQALAAGAREAAEMYGAGAGASRLVTGTTALHRELEHAIATWMGTEAAIVFSSGYLANATAIPVLAGAGDEVFSDAANHASIVDGCRLSRARTVIYPHGDAVALASVMAASTARRKLVVTDSIFSMDGDGAPLREIVDAAEEHGAMVLLDESHAFGVLGPGGAGLADACGLGHRVSARMATLSKAAAGSGGFIAGSTALVELLRNRARGFIFDTAPAPPAVGAAVAALRVMADEPWRRVRLLELTRRLRDGLAAGGFHAPAIDGPIVPLLVGGVEPAMNLAAALRREGVIAPAIRPPSVAPGTCRLRLTVSAGFSDDQVDRALAAIISAGRSGGLV